MAAEKPSRRLSTPTPVARAARSVFDDGLVIPNTDPIVRYVPVVQWHQMRLRCQISGTTGVIGVEFARPARQIPPGIPGGQSYLYTVDNPAIDGTAWADGVELSLEVSGAEHHGENWLVITLTAAGAGVVDFFDISGDLQGL